MNVTRFNDTFANLMAKLNWKGWDCSPLFDYEMAAEHALEIIEPVYAPKAGEEMPPLPPLPFNLFRLNVATRPLAEATHNQKCRYHAVVKLIAPGEWSVALTNPAIFGGLSVPILVIENLRLAPVGFHGTLNLFDSVSGVFVPAEVRLAVELERDLREEQMRGVALIGAFALDAMAPTNHIVSVCPAKEGKSVQWTQARTHYTLITHDHPANNKTVQHRANVTDDAKAEMTRMAHNRRAHFKTLKHERYRFARGKRIFVRAAWVGPKEWKDAGGKQIYRILEPVS